ncbi:glutamine amidotransferase [Pseudomonas sp. P2757]|uniref:glutamine amidotransferase n=1 Tax=unclassified Pseudomonas TaxID=196821 RepID=UPI003B5C8268
MSRLPIIGVTDCSLQRGLHAHHISGDTSVHSAASKARGLSAISRYRADHAATSSILDARPSILFSGSLFNIDLFHIPGLRGAYGRARDSARAGCAQEMQRQRKGQVSSSFIVLARCPA